MNSLYAVFIKRVFDVVFAIIFIPITVVPMLLIFLAIKLSSSGPAIFRQIRVGRYGVHFTIYKFRSMRADAPDNISTCDFVDAGIYITPIGRFLRRTSLDELPQLFNILKGDMSLVGPRPLIVGDKKRVAMHRKLGIDTLRPGLTGWAQVSGRDAIPDREKVWMDAYYLLKLSLLMDMGCIVRTVLVVLNRSGNVEGSELALHTRDLDSRETI